MALSPAHEIVGLEVYQRAEGDAITMAMVREVLAELSAHAGCACGSCSWVSRADPVKVWRSADYYQRQHRSAGRAARRVHS